MVNTYDIYVVTTNGIRGYLYDDLIAEFSKLTRKTSDEIFEFLVELEGLDKGWTVDQIPKMAGVRVIPCYMVEEIQETVYGEHLHSEWISDLDT